MTMRKYILDGHTPVPIGNERATWDLNYCGTPEWAEELLTWGKFMQEGDRRVALNHVWGIEVSTVFLGCDHGWNFSDDANALPILFETMVFGGVLADYQERYCTWDEAAAGHAATLRRVRALAIPSFFVEIYRSTAQSISAIYKNLKDGK